MNAGTVIFWFAIIKYFILSLVTRNFAIYNFYKEMNICVFFLISNDINQLQWRICADERTCAFITSYLSSSLHFLCNSVFIEDHYVLDSIILVDRILLKTPTAAASGGSTIGGIVRIAS